VLRHRRLETFAIEIGRHDLVAVLFQRLDDGAEQRVVVALDERMAVDDLNQHDGKTTLLPPRLFQARSYG
jgi:hypothetical protein